MGLLLVPLVGLLAPSGGRASGVAASLFADFGIATPFVRLTALLALFAAVLALRDAVLVARDRRLASMSLGFVEEQRVG